MGKSSAPPAPDYASAAEKTAAGNIEAARSATRANRVNTYTPFGSLTYSQPSRVFDQAGYDAAMAQYQNAQNSQSTPQSGKNNSPPNGEMVWDPSYGENGGYVPSKTGSSASSSSVNPPNKNDFWSGSPDDWTANLTLSPDQQALLDARTQSQLKESGLESGAVDRVSAALGQAMPEAYDPDKASSKAYDLIMQRMQPDIERDRAAMQTRLANQGLTNGSEAYNNDYTQEEKKVNDARIAAALAAMQEGRAEQGTTFAQQMGLRQAPLNELNAIRSGTQVTMPSFPNFSQQGQTSGPNYNNAALNQYQGAMNSFNVDQANAANTQQSLMSMAAMAAMFFSDIRIKKHIRKIGTHNGLGIYNYFNMMTNRWENGLIAQEVASVKPHAVARHPNGLLMVNYALALEN